MRRRGAARPRRRRRRPTGSGAARASRSRSRVRSIATVDQERTPPTSSSSSPSATRPASGAIAARHAVPAGSSVSVGGVGQAAMRAPVSSPIETVSTRRPMIPASVAVARTRPPSASLGRARRRSRKATSGSSSRSEPGPGAKQRVGEGPPSGVSWPVSGRAAAVASPPLSTSVISGRRSSIAASSALSWARRLRSPPAGGSRVPASTVRTAGSRASRSSSSGPSRSTLADEVRQPAALAARARRSRVASVAASTAARGGGALRATSRGQLGAAPRSDAPISRPIAGSAASTRSRSRSRIASRGMPAGSAREPSRRQCPDARPTRAADVVAAPWSTAKKAFGSLTLVCYPRSRARGPR